jgi:Flp pilus assembly protein TadG
MNKLGSRTPDATPPALCRGFNGFCATASCATTSAKAVEPLGQAQGRLRDARGIQRQNRRGTILVITALVLIALVGLMGLVIDAGQLMTANRVAQNAADAAATGAAMDMLTGKSNSTASATATTFVQQYNGLANATVVVNIPPASGAHAGNSQYAEAIVTNSVPVWFIQILGVGSQQTVMARAVAGWEGAGFGAGVLVLDTNTRPGLTLNGNAELAVNGTVVVNSNGGGRNEYGQPINNGNSGSAISLLGNRNWMRLVGRSCGMKLPASISRSLPNECSSDVRMFAVSVQRMRWRSTGTEWA